jgi:hypothetical protein
MKLRDEGHEDMAVHPEFTADAFRVTSEQFQNPAFPSEYRCMIRFLNIDGL